MILFDQLMKLKHTFLDKAIFGAIIMFLLGFLAKL